MMAVYGFGGDLMIKGKIVVTKTQDRLFFYYVIENNRLYLFTDKYTKGLFIYFRRGRSVNELIEYRRWGRNPRIDKTVTKIPTYIKYVMKESS